MRSGRRRSSGGSPAAAGQVVKSAEVCVLAATAQAATGANTSECDPAQQPSAEEPPVDPPAETPDSVIVSPAAPALSDVACGVEPAVLIPEMDGVACGQTRTGNVVTVTATAEPSLVLAEGAVATRPLDVTPQPCACVPDGIDPGTVTFDGVIDKSGSYGALTEWGALQFDLATSGQSAYSTSFASCSMTEPHPSWNPSSSWRSRSAPLRCRAVAEYAVPSG